MTIAGPPIAPSTPADGASRILRLDDVERCFEGAIPAVVATASADGVPNVIYVSRAHRVDDERIALSNQFLSKTARNIAVNPRASVLLVDPLTHDEYRLSIVYERTERRGPVFERLRTDIDALAALVGMTGVFRLRAADIFRVLELEQVPPNTVARPAYRPATRRSSPELSALAELARRVSRSGDVDSVIETALSGLGELFGYQSCRLLLLDEDTGRLRFVAGPGPESQAVEVEIGHGVIGMAAERCQTMRVGNLGQILKYSRSVRSQYEQAGVSGLTELSGPHESGVESVVAAPLQALGQLLGVLVAESSDAAAFGPADEQVLTTIGTHLGAALEHLRLLDRWVDDAAADRPEERPRPSTSPRREVTVRHFAVDGSTFVDGDYLIRGVGGRILWALLRQHVEEGRVDFNNKELRLDPSLDLPGFKDNLESRLLLLTRRLDDKGAPIRIERTGRGRFRLEVTAEIQLDPAG